MGACRRSQSVALATMFIIVIIAIVEAGSALADSMPQLPTVSLHNGVQVTASKIVLSDVADIEADEHIVNVLANVEIGPSPLAGRERTISAGYVQMRLARAGFGVGTVEFGGSPKVRVYRHHSQRPALSLSSENGNMSQSASAKIPPVTIKKGDKVQILVRSGGILIVTTGQALEECSEGEITIVRVGETGRRISGQVTGPREITVNL